MELWWISLCWCLLRYGSKKIFIFIFFPLHPKSDYSTRSRYHKTSLKWLRASITPRRDFLVGERARKLYKISGSWSSLINFLFFFILLFTQPSINSYWDAILKVLKETHCKLTKVILLYQENEESVPLQAAVPTRNSSELLVESVVDQDVQNVSFSYPVELFVAETG